MQTAIVSDTNNAILFFIVDIFFYLEALPENFQYFCMGHHFVSAGGAGTGIGNRFQIGHDIGEFHNFFPAAFRMETTSS